MRQMLSTLDLRANRIGDEGAHLLSVLQQTRPVRLYRCPYCSHMFFRLQEIKLSWWGWRSRHRIDQKQVHKHFVLWVFLVDWISMNKSAQYSRIKWSVVGFTNGWGQAYKPLSRVYYFQKCEPTIDTGSGLNMPKNRLACSSVHTVSRPILEEYSFWKSIQDFIVLVIALRNHLDLFLFSLKRVRWKQEGKHWLFLTFNHFLIKKIKNPKISLIDEKNQKNQFNQRLRWNLSFFVPYRKIRFLSELSFSSVARMPACAVFRWVFTSQKPA